MPYRLLPLLLLAPALSIACAGDPTPEPVDFALTVHDDNEATLAGSGTFVWWRNAIPEAEYLGYATSFDKDGWEHVRSEASLQVIQRKQQWLGAGLTLGERSVISFDGLQFGFGWRAVHVIAEEPLPIDLEALGLAPEGERFAGVDFSRCEIPQARVLVALSEFPGTEAELIDRARQSASEQDLSAPKDWYDVVRDPNMYEFLFGEVGTEHVPDTTFASLAVQLHPRCGSWRFVFAAEEELNGPIAVRH